MTAITLSEYRRDEQAQGRSPEDIERDLSRYEAEALRDIREEKRPKWGDIFSTIQAALAEEEKPK